MPWPICIEIYFYFVCPIDNARSLDNHEHFVKGTCHFLFEFFYGVMIESNDHLKEFSLFGTQMVR